MGYLNCELGFEGKKVVFKSRVGETRQLKNAIKHLNYKQHELYWDKVKAFISMGDETYIEVILMNIASFFT